MGEGVACPACGTPAVGDPWCGSCGLELSGSEAQHFRSLAAQLAAAEGELDGVRRRRDLLAAELSSLQWSRQIIAQPPAASAPPLAPAAWPPAARPKAEWNVERVRNVLLWTGATLLALSALAFTAVAWTHLGPVGRAVLLVVITIVCAFGAVAARDRLPATSGALTGLTIALALIDWQIVRRAGIAPGVSGTAWWSIGTAVVSAASLALGRVASPVPARRAVAVLAPVSALLAVASSSTSSWNAALGLSALAALLVGVDRMLDGRVADPVVRALVRIEAGASWIVGAVLVVAAAVEPTVFGETLTPAAVMLTFALAPALSRRVDRVPIAAAVIAPFVGAALTLQSIATGPIGQITFAVVLGGVAVAVAPWLREGWRRAAQLVGIAVAAPGILLAGVVALIAEIGPLKWLANAWTGTMSTNALRVVAGPNTSTLHEAGWCVVGILAVVAVAIPCALRRPIGARPVSNPILARAIGAGVLFVAISLVPLAAGASVRVVCITATVEVVVALLGSAIAARRHPDRALPFGLLVLIPAVPLTGWAAITPTASVATLSIVVVAAALSAAVGRVASLRAAHAAVAGTAFSILAAVSTLAAGASLSAAGFAAGVSAAAVLLFGAQARRGTADGVALEVVGGLGILGGVLAASQSLAWVAGTLTAAVPFLLAASLRRHRTIVYGAAAATAALGAIWAWLAAAGVTVVEAYTLPAAAAALGAAALAHRGDVAGWLGRAHGEGHGLSWLYLGPALVLALGPTLALAISRHDDTRAIVVGLAALATLLMGSRHRLQAPIVLGAITLFALGVDKLGPQAVRLPRWLMLAFAGSVLLWVGTTFERRRDEVMRAARRFERMG